MLQASESSSNCKEEPIGAVYCNGEQLKCLFAGGLEAIEEHQQEVDSLNVFPVPDGDTGRNMYLTMAAAVKEMEIATTSHIGNVGRLLPRVH